MYRCGFCGADFSTEQEAAGHMMKHIANHAAKQEQGKNFDWVIDDRGEIQREVPIDDPEMMAALDEMMQGLLLKRAGYLIPG
jgi:hypothetical protein